MDAEHRTVVLLVVTASSEAAVTAGPALGGGAAERPLRVLRVIARMNVGGPAHHVALLSGLMDPARFETLLVTGRVGPGEASLAHLAERQGARVVVLDALGPQIRPLADLRALLALVGVVRRFAPDIVHTHTAKAGMLARVAARIGRAPRPIVVHTYHGHVLEGYFGPARSRVYRAIEQGLARLSDCLVGVSDATVDDLVRLGVAERSRFRVVRLGLDLEPFAAARRASGAGFRADIGAREDDVVLTFVGRLVPIKRVDVLLRAVARALGEGARVRLAVVGDGELRPRLERLATQLGIDERVTFLGFRDDPAAVAAGCDVAVLTSDSEGTPVWLIEAAAAGRPTLATDVGGVAEVVAEGTGMLAPRGDEQAVARAIQLMAADSELRERLGSEGRRYVVGRYAVGRLVGEVEELYEQLLRSRSVRASAASAIASEGV